MEYGAPFSLTDLHRAAFIPAANHTNHDLLQLGSLRGCLCKSLRIG